MNSKTKRSPAERSARSYGKKRARGLVRLSIWVCRENLPLFHQVQSLPWGCDLRGILTPEEWRSLLLRVGFPPSPLRAKAGSAKAVPEPPAQPAGSRDPARGEQGHFDF